MADTRNRSSFSEGRPRSVATGGMRCGTPAYAVAPARIDSQSMNLDGSWASLIAEPLAL